MNRTTEIIFAGFGGQGVLSMGKIIAYAAMIENKEVCWMPSYGPEMRGGTANCTVIISDNKISSPFPDKFDIAVLLNQPSVDKYQFSVKNGGLLVFEKSNIITPPTGNDMEILAINAFEEANKLNNKQIANMIIIGAMISKRNIVKNYNLIEALKKVLPERHHHLIELNEKAIETGRKIAQFALPV